MTVQFFSRTERFIQGAKTLEQRYYVAGEVFTKELERIFYQQWVCVGRSSQVPRPGDYFLQEIGEESLIILRNKTGALGCFYNVCRHRGTRICTETSGKFSETIQCPYHAWTYTLDGRLVGAPLMQEVDEFDRELYPLHQAAIAEWEGFLFVNLSDEPEPFETAFAPLIGRFERFGLPGLQATRRIEYDVQANWKLIVQNYSECLHCPTLHPMLAHISPYQSGKNDLVAGPFLGGYMEIIDEAGSLTMTGRVCGIPIGHLPAEDFKRVYYYTIFPNLLLSMHPDYVMYHLLWPGSAGGTRITCDWMFHPASFNRPDFDADDAINFWDMTNRQDWAICEQSHVGIRSRAYQPGPYSVREGLLAAWDKEYLRVVEK